MCFQTWSSSRFCLVWRSALRCAVSHRSLHTYLQRGVWWCRDFELIGCHPPLDHQMSLPSSLPFSVTWLPHPSEHLLNPPSWFHPTLISPASYWARPFPQRLFQVIIIVLKYVYFSFFTRKCSSNSTKKAATMMISTNIMNVSNAFSNLRGISGLVEPWNKSYERYSQWP